MGLSSAHKHKRCQTTCSTKGFILGFLHFISFYPLRLYSFYPIVSGLLLPHRHWIAVTCLHRIAFTLRHCIAPTVIFYLENGRISQTVVICHLYLSSAFNIFTPIGESYFYLFCKIRFYPFMCFYAHFSNLHLATSRIYVLAILLCAILPIYI